MIHLAFQQKSSAPNGAVGGGLHHLFLPAGEPVMEFGGEAGVQEYYTMGTGETYQ
jgi:hypothetical protein